MLWGFAQTLWFLERDRDEQNDAKGRKSHQASCDQARTVVSKDLGHLVPPFVSGKTKEVRAEFPAGRFVDQYVCICRGRTQFHQPSFVRGWDMSALGH
jgi:hypothetical protein